MDNWKHQDAISSIQAQMQEIDRMVLRAAFDGRVSGDSKRKVSMLLKDIERRFNEIPERI